MTPRQFYALIGSVFGWSAEYGDTFHAGQDYPWGAGTAIPSPGSGRVVAKGHTSEAGNYVTIIIGSAYFIFYHLLQPSNLVVGQQVSFGDTVGLVGASGDTTGPHLHLAVSNDPRPGEGNRVDPLPIVNALIAANGSSSAGGGGSTPIPIPLRGDTDMRTIVRKTTGKYYTIGLGILQHQADWDISVQGINLSGLPAVEYTDDIGFIRALYACGLDEYTAIDTDKGKVRSLNSVDFLPAGGRLVATWLAAK